MENKTRMTKKRRALAIMERLKEEYPVPECTLDTKEAWKLLVSVRLAAQCTDARVNIIVKDLFAKYPSNNKNEIDEIIKGARLRAKTFLLKKSSLPSFSAFNMLFILSFSIFLFFSLPIFNKI